MKYFKREWNESAGNDSTDNWGISIYYFETDNEFNVLRQIQVFENNKALKYDLNYLDDKLGGLSEVPLDFEDFSKYQIDPMEFNEIWDSHNYKKFPEIVITNNVLWGQPRLDGRRLAVGDIVSLVDVNQDINIVQEDFELSLQEIRQAFHYCKLKQCIDDISLKYCHNCTLRVEQEDNEYKDEQDNWLIAEKLMKQYFNQ